MRVHWICLISFEKVNAHLLISNYLARIWCLSNALGPAGLGHWTHQNSVRVHWICLISLEKVNAHLLISNYLARIWCLSNALGPAGLGHWTHQNSVRVHWICLISLEKVNAHLLISNYPLHAKVDNLIVFPPNLVILFIFLLKKNSHFGNWVNDYLINTELLWSDMPWAKMLICHSLPLRSFGNTVWHFFISRIHCNLASFLTCQTL